MLNSALLLLILIISSVTNIESFNNTTNTTDPHRNHNKKPTSKPVYKYPTKKPQYKYPSSKPQYKYPSSKPQYKYPSTKPQYKYPTYSPSKFPTTVLSPTKLPTKTPSKSPSKNPSKKPSFAPSLSPTFLPSVVPTQGTCQCKSLSTVGLNPTAGPSIVACFSGDSFFGVYDLQDTSFTNNYLLPNLDFPNPSNISNCHGNMFTNVSPLSSSIGAAYCINGECKILYYFESSVYIYDCTSNSDHEIIPQYIHDVACPYNLNLQPTCSCQELLNDLLDPTASAVVVCWNSTKPNMYFGVYEGILNNIDFTTNLILKNPKFPNYSPFPVCTSTFDGNYTNERPIGGVNHGLAYEVGTVPFYVYFDSFNDLGIISRFPNCDFNSQDFGFYFLRNSAVCPSNLLNPVTPLTPTCSCEKYPTNGVGPDIVACWNDLTNEYFGVYDAADTLFTTNLIQNNPNFPGSSNIPSCPSFTYDNAYPLDSSAGLTYMVGTDAYYINSVIGINSVVRCNNQFTIGPVEIPSAVTCPASILKEGKGSLQTTSQTELNQDSKVTIIIVVSIVSTILFAGIMFMLYRKYKSNKTKDSTEDYTLESFYVGDVNHGHCSNNQMEATNSVQLPEQHDHTRNSLN